MPARDETRSRLVLLLGLFTEDRQAVVVGGGAVAARKVRLLLDAGAEVTVVAPTLDDSLRTPVDAGGVAHDRATFAERHLDGATIVIAATDDPAVNRRVLQAARDRKILCSSVDECWPEGDFVTPATVRRDDLVIAVSTGGRSCRKARLIKDGLARHIEMLTTADLLVMGVAPTMEAERVGRMAAGLWGVHEFILVRQGDVLELWAVACPGEATEELLAQVLGGDRQGSVKWGCEALEHTATCDDLEAAQRALAEAAERGWAGVLMQAWLKELTAKAGDPGTSYRRIVGSFGENPSD